MEPILKKEESNIYLIREMESNKEINNWIKQNFDELFVNERNNWFTNESFIPTLVHTK